MAQIAGWVPIIEESSGRWHDYVAALRELVGGCTAGRARGIQAFQRELTGAYCEMAGMNYLLADECDRASVPAEVDSLQFEHAGLHGGLCEIAWFTEHLAQLRRGTGRSMTLPASNETDGRASEPLGACDSLLLAELRDSPWRGSYELSSGLTGFGVYFLNRLPDENAAAGIDLVLTELERLARTCDGDITWVTAWAEMTPNEKNIRETGYSDLSIPQGVAGVIYFLNELVCCGLHVERAGCLLDGSVRWLLKQQTACCSLSRFKSYSRAAAPTRDRLSWSEGDLGILAVLSQVARRNGQDGVRVSVRELLSHCLGWPSDLSGVRDLSLADGGAGIGHIYNRLYQADGGPQCREASRAWFDWTVLQIRSHEGEIQSPHVPHEVPATQGWSLLYGAGGVALALLAAMSSVEPIWDRILGLSGHSTSLIGRETAALGGSQCH